MMMVKMKDRGGDSDDDGDNDNIDVKRNNTDHQAQHVAEPGLDEEEQLLAGQGF